MAAIKEAALEQDGTGQSLTAQALAWMDNPFTAFGMSLTRVHSVSRRDVEEIQLAALNLRLQQKRTQIPVLAKLAEAQNITTIDSLNGAAPLLFEHNVYKSYPISLLAKQRFDQLTKWLARLTPYDLSGIDTSNCTSIDEWLGLLQKETLLDVATSSGTSGTLSFLPKTRKDYSFTVLGHRMEALQTFGTEPDEKSLHDKVHVVTAGYRDGHSSMARFPHYFREIFGLGDDAYLHTASANVLSTDLMWLAGRLRAAAAKGDASRVEVPENLLARRAELEAMQRELPAQQASFIQTITDKLAGRRVYVTGQWPMLYDAAKRGLANGKRGVFSSDSVLLTGGGAKGMTIPEDFDETLLEFFGVPRIRKGYGMTELNSYMLGCEHDRLHVCPWLIPFVLDADTGQPLPRTGVQTGRAAYFDMTVEGNWGGIVTGDKITVDWDTPCACGRSTVHIHPKVERFSELQGGDDKISCAATPGAQAEALDYLNNLES